MNKKNLKARRLALGMRIRDLADQSGVSYGSCWNYEHGRAGHAIMDKYMAVVACLDRLEKERSEAQKEEEPC